MVMMRIFIWMNNKQKNRVLLTHVTRKMGGFSAATGAIETMEEEIFQAINDDSVEVEYGENFSEEVLENLLSVLEVRLENFEPVSNINLLEEIYSHSADPNNPVREKITCHIFSDKYKGTMDQKFDGQEYLDDKIAFWWKTMKNLKKGDVQKIMEFFLDEI